MNSYGVRVEIFLKPGVLDAQGKAIGQSLVNLGYSDIEKLRVGKQIIFQIKAESESVAEVRIHEVCKKLLVNEVIENYSFRFL